MWIKYRDRLVLDFTDNEDKVNVIIGNSGVGKTKLVDDIRQCVNLYMQGDNITSDIDIKSIEILDYTDIVNKKYKQFNEKTIFVDRFDRKTDDEFIRFIKESRNCFYLIGRDRVFELGSLISFNILLYDGNTYRLVNKYYDRVEFNRLYKTQV